MAGPDLPFSSQSSSLSPMLELELELELERELEPEPVDHGGGGDDAIDGAVLGVQDVAHIRQPP